jgi:hypothetical protein
MSHRKCQEGLMKDLRRLNVSLVLALAAALTASPVVAQGKGKAHGKTGKHRTEQVKRARGGDGWKDVRLERRESGRVARGRGGSYEATHRAFHREHDRACRERAAQRPFDVRWQLRVRAECKAAHHRWHERHDGSPY